MSKHRRGDKLYKPPIPLDKKLEKKGIKFHMLRPFKFKKVMRVECPHRDNEFVTLRECKSCKNWLGSTINTRNHWLCLKKKEK